MIDELVPFGPTGQVVYSRTYSRVKPDGSRETWPETVHRVAKGNLALVHGKDMAAWPEDAHDEFQQLTTLMEQFAIIPAGRHLWASGVKGREFLSNCFVSGWGPKLSDHFEFTFMRLMEGGGVGANYSSNFLEPFGAPRRWLKLHIVCDPEHPDYDDMVAAGVISADFSHEWEGAFPVEDSREGWAAALVDLIDTHMTDDEVLHRDRVYDVSRVRAKGRPLRTFGGSASGPLPFARMMHETCRILSQRALDEESPDWLRPDFTGTLGYLSPMEAMGIDHAIAECVVSGGVRRSARMAQLHWEDPAIFEFIRCKADTGKHWTTNISVIVDDEFFIELESGGRWAHQVLDAVVDGMLANGEPGFWNISLSNEGEVNPVVSTNPCLTGDTVIATVNGPRTFADLAEAGEDVLVYSWHPQSKKPVVRWMRHPHCTARNAEILKVTFDSGLVVRCTPNHGFYSFRGKKIEARNLKVGQSIRAFSASRDSSGHERIHGWDSKRNAADHQWTHRMLWEALVGPIPEGYVIAHLDNNGQNNSPDNLALMTDLGHRRYDMPMRQAAGMNGHSPNHKVVAVERGGYADVYNGMVEDSHTYIVLDPDPIAGHMSGIVSANCGEIPLPEWGACMLGHVNMDYFVGPNGYDELGAEDAHRLMTRFLIRATFGDASDPRQRAVTDRDRRIGVGHMGVQGWICKQGIKYSEAPLDHMIGYWLDNLKHMVRETARNYAFQLRIPEPIKVTTVAPTGTIAKLPGVTEGIHPIYARHFLRRVRFTITDPAQADTVLQAKEDGFEVEQDMYDRSGNTMVVVYPTKDKLVSEVEALGWGAALVESADEISVTDALAFQAMYQKHYADNAVSYTVNFPEGSVTHEELAEALKEYLPLLKGTTVMPDGTRPQAPYERLTEAEFLSYLATRVEDSVDEECAKGACPIR